MFGEVYAYNLNLRSFLTQLSPAAVFIVAEPRFYIGVADLALQCGT